MKTRSRFNSPLLIVVVVILIGVMLLWMRKDNPTGTLGVSTSRPFNGEDSPGLSSSTLKSGIEAGAVRSDDPAKVRGAGYIWGTALKNVFAGAALDSDGKTRLNVSALEKSFKGNVAPIDLASATAAPQLRAEYLSASITAALDLDAVHQPKLVAILEGIYADDSAASDSEEDARARQRAELTEQARIKILSSLPPEVLDQFSEIFRSPRFLFETRSFVVDSIDYNGGGGALSTKGNTVFSIGNDGKVSITSESTTFRQDRAIRKRN